MTERRLTIRELAAHAGLSPSAVSAALRKLPSIPQATRERVEKIAQKLGYRPDPMLGVLGTYRKSLKPTHHSTIAVVDNWPQKGLTEWNRASRNVFSGASEQAEKLGYRIEPFWMREFKSHRKASDVLYHRGIRGLILEALPQGLGHLRLQWERFCTVTYCFDFPAPPLHRVTGDDFDQMITLRRKLAQFGYKRVGLITDKRNERSARHRDIAAHVFWDSRYKTSRKPIPHLTVDNQRGEASKIVSWYQTYRPDVIIGHSSGNLHLLLEQGIRIPEDVAFVSREITEEEAWITGVIPNHRGIGAVTVNLLHGMITRGEYGVPANPQTILIRNEWNDGTTAPKKGR